MVGALASILLIRHLGQNNYGKYATAMAFSMLFCSFLDFGMSPALVRAASRDYKDAGWFYGTHLGIKLTIALLAYGGLALFGSIANYHPQTYTLILILGFASIARSFHSSFSAIMEARLRMVMVSIFTSLIPVTWFAAVLFLRARGEGVVSFGKANAAVFIGYGLVWFSVTLFLVKPKLHLKKAPEVLRKSAFFGLIFVFFFIYMQTGVVILSILKGETPAGIFAAAFKIVMLALAPLLLVSKAILPIMYKYGKSNREKLARLYSLVSRILITAGGGLFLVLFLFSSPIVHLIYGAKMAQASPVLAVLSLFVLVRFLTDFNGSTLLSLDRVKAYSFMRSKALLANIAACFLAIPFFGAGGAAVALVASDLILAYQTYHALAKEGIIKDPIFKIALRALPLALSTCCAWLLKQVIAWYFAAPTGIVILVAFSFAVRIIGKKDIHEFKKVFSTQETLQT